MNVGPSVDEQMLRLRQRMQDAMRVGLFDTKEGASGATQQLLLQMLNEAHRAEQSCLTEIERLRHNIENMRGKAAGFSAMRNLIFDVFNSLVNINEKSLQEQSETALSNETLKTGELSVPEQPDGVRKRGKLKRAESDD